MNAMNKAVISIMAAVMAVACALVGCHGERGRVKDTLAGMRKHPITLPLDRMQCRYGGEDTVMHDSITPKLRMVVYIDSAYCTSCALDRMRQWNGLIADAARYKGDLGYVFIAAEYHVFLMDENGNVLFVGNPLGGEELKELYKKTVRSNIH